MLFAIFCTDSLFSFFFFLLACVDNFLHHLSKGYAQGKARHQNCVKTCNSWPIVDPLKDTVVSTNTHSTASCLDHSSVLCCTQNRDLADNTGQAFCTSSLNKIFLGLNIVFCTCCKSGDMSCRSSSFFSLWQIMMNEGGWCKDNPLFLQNVSQLPDLV